MKKHVAAVAGRETAAPVGRLIDDQRRTVRRRDYLRYAGTPTKRGAAGDGHKQHQKI
ncbi:MAG: hypothetical protein RXR20_00905 [Paraburkholderia sp.]|jgi:hypothetical protein|uniref:hypothetical protein n=1 Tax=Burkholderiaceae TaxID=119060 RepID=UPI001485B601|nr:hypothetical protein [Burkholderia sp. 4M9327F10]